MVSVGRSAFLLLVLLLSSIFRSQQLTKKAYDNLSSNVANLTHKRSNVNGSIIRKRWAILVAGSRGYVNYRHQADVCHAYQVLRKGGLKDENIVVFMYDDIAFNDENPRPGIIINKPDGDDVYQGVPKDYNGANATADNFFAVLLGNKSALKGGSGKVVDSGPNDYIFIYYCDHGSPGLIGMPSGDDLHAKDLLDVLKKKHEAKTYKSMVFYLEACESGSMFEGLLPSNWSIYAVTAANAEESSWATYCPGQTPAPSLEYDTCLGDIFSVSWMEDSDIHDMSMETIEKQYKVVQRRTEADNIGAGSHVMQYGNRDLSKDFLSIYIGTNPKNNNYTFEEYISSTSRVVNQKDVDLLYFKHKIQKAAKGSQEKIEAEKILNGAIYKRKHEDSSMKNIAIFLFGDTKGREVLKFVRPSGQPLVDDWSCLKLLVKVYEQHCGPLSWYGKQYNRAIANMCNAGINIGQMTMAAIEACTKNNPSFNI